jgi:hypothetical protein
MAMTATEAALWGAFGALLLILLECAETLGVHGRVTPRPGMKIVTYLVTVVLRILPGSGAAAAAADVLSNRLGALVIGATLPLTLTVTLRKAQAQMRKYELKADKSASAIR